MGLPHYCSFNNIYCECNSIYEIQFKFNISKGLPSERPLHHMAIEVNADLPPLDLRRVQLVARQGQRWLRQAASVGAGGPRPCPQLLGEKFAALMRTPTPRPPTFWISPTRPGLRRASNPDDGVNLGPLHAARAILVALGTSTTPALMEPGRTVGDAHEPVVVKLAPDPDGAVSHAEWPVLGSAQKRTQEQDDRAREFAQTQEAAYRALVRSSHGGHGLVCYCDGSTTPFPTERVRSQAGLGHNLSATHLTVDMNRMRQYQQPAINTEEKAAGAAVVGTFYDVAAGSWVEDSGWGAAIQPPWNWDNEGTELAGLLIFTEVAIHQARRGRLRQWILAARRDGRRVPVVCLCDCQEPVRQARNGKPADNGAYWSTLERILRNVATLHNMGVDVHINWVPGHCGLHWNELVDARANAARIGEGIHSQMQQDLRGHRRLPTPLAVANRQILDAMRQTWHERWIRSVSTRDDRRLAANPVAYVQTPKEWYSLVNGTGRGDDYVGRWVATTADRLLVGASTTNEFLFHSAKDGVRRPRRCDACSVTEPSPPGESEAEAKIRERRTGECDSIEHRFDHCPAYGRHRRHLYFRLRGVQGLVDSPSLLHLLALHRLSKVGRRAVVWKVRGFLADTGLDKIIRKRKRRVPRAEGVT